MSSVIWNQLVFQRIATFYQFLLHAVATLLSKVFQRLLNYSFDTISDKKLQLFCSRSHRSEFQDISAVCLPFISGNIFLPMADDQTMFSFVVSKVQNEQGILLFVHWKLAWESYVLGTCLGSLFEILVAHGWIIGASGNQAPIRQQPC